MGIVEYGSSLVVERSGTFLAEVALEYLLVFAIHSSLVSLVEPQ